MNRDTFKQKYEEKHRKNRELIESDHEAALLVRNPEEGLKTLQEPEKNAFSFEAADVSTYIIGQSQRQQQGTPIIEDLEEDIGGFPYNGVNDTTIQKYVADSLEEATERDEYGMVTNDKGVSEFAYIGDLDLDVDSV